MKARIHLRREGLVSAGSVLLPILLFWIVLAFRIPPSFTQNFHAYSPVIFFIVLIFYYISFCLPKNLGIFVCLCLTMLLFGLSLSYLWTSGFSDNFIISGLLPYKDAKNYYYGANLILNGIPVVNAQQATERPLFPAFLASALFLMGENLKIAIAVITQLMGLGLYLSARQIRNLFGALSASVYAVFLYFYIQTLIGYTMSETFGFALGCFAFALILPAALHLKRVDLMLGLVILIVAVSARAGTFIIFPLFVIWTGWVLRVEKRFSWKAAGVAFVITTTAYLLVNAAFPRFLDIPSGSSFKNFSYAIYGQVRGGIGWHSAIVELGTRDSSTVYRAAFQYFLEHPTQLFVGFAKAYHDFFTPGARGIFSVIWDKGQTQLSFLLSLAALALMVLGLIRLIKDVHHNPSSLLLAGFIGVILSIPFLPPVDGDVRFYASTTPFIFAVAALGISSFLKGLQEKYLLEEDLHGELLVSRFSSLSLLALTLLIPSAIYVRGYKPAHELPVCEPKQKVFVMEPHPGTYIDLVKDKSSACGFLPEMCLDDFDKNNSEKSVDDFYQRLLTLTENNAGNVRIIEGFDLVAERLHYYFVSRDKLPDDPLPKLMSGCAVTISTRNQIIFQVESILPR